MNKIPNRDLSTRLAVRAGQQIILRRRLIGIALHRTGEDPERRSRDAHLHKELR